MHRIPLNITLGADYESEARDVLKPDVWGFVAGGAGNEQALRSNRAAFDQVTIVPRMLRDVSRGSTRVTILAREFCHPILLAPVGYQRLYSEWGEIDTVQGADAADANVVVSTLSSVRLEDLPTHSQAPLWFQLYCQPRLEESLSLVRRAESAGYSALVITVDTPVQMMMPAAKREGFSLPETVRAVNLDEHAKAPFRALEPEESLVFQGAMADAPSWREIEQIIAETALPVLLKGILHADDAVRALAAGAKGIVVSNHGGRTLGSAPASLRRLRETRKLLGPDATILFDSGIRSGEDIFKAIALGANAVLIGRLQVYALAVAGALGVAHLMKLLREELELTMALAGVSSIEDISEQNVEVAF